MPCLPTVSGRLLELSASALSVHCVSRLSRPKLAQWLTLAAIVAPSLSSPAATFIWDGNPPNGRGNSHWSTGGNWAGGIAPNANDYDGLFASDLIFTGHLKTAPFLRANYYVHSISFASGAAAFRIESNGEGIYLGAGGLTNYSANLQTITVPLTLRANQTWNAAAGDLAVTGLLDLNSHTLTIAGNARTSISNRIVDTGALVKDGLGELLLSGGLANTFSGGVTVNGGTVTVGKIGALGTGPLALNGGVLNLGSYNATVSAFTLHGGSLSSSGGQLVSSSGYQVESGTIASGLGGSGRLTKSGAGTVTLLAGNTYAGGTEISGGKLVANNTLGSATGTGSVLVRGGGLLTGSGSISGIVTNGLGGSISAGDEIGVLHLGSTLWLGGATNRWDISDATGGAGVGWDLLSINGSLTLSATTDERAIIDIVSFTLSDQPGLASNFDPTQNYLWTIVQTTGGIYFPSGEDATTIFDLFTGNFANSTAGSFGLTVSADGRSLNVFYAAALPVPEPNQIVLMGLGLCGLVYIRRFKQHWA